ncbi:MAG: calcium:proton exchanger, partial [Lachnospiraceae bacterium]|nr:calcium:proton exchanger [Lachnospiraceae bacterium]
MPKRQHRISYIKKPFAKKSLVSLPFACVALAAGAVSLIISAYHQGNGDVNVAAWGFSSMVFAT